MKNKLKLSEKINHSTKKSNSQSQNNSYINKSHNHSVPDGLSGLNTKISYESIKNLTEEIGHIKEFCKELKKSNEENCIMQNERKNFEKIKTEHIKLHADVNIIKEDLKELMGNYQHLMQRINYLEEENKTLRQHNKNLVRYIQSGNFNTDVTYGNYINTNSNYNNDKNLRSKIKNAYPDEDHNHYNNKVNVDYSSPLSEMSAFNTMNNQSSVEMNNNINNNLENTRKRYLIPKSGDMDYRKF